MGYWVEFIDPVLDYLVGIEGLSEPDRARMITEVRDELATHAEHFHTLYPLEPESYRFRYPYALSTQQGIFEVDFVVDGSRMEMGAVTVIYFEYAFRPIN